VQAENLSVQYHGQTKTTRYQDIDFLWDGFTGRYRFGIPCQNMG
jgi:hypothetical protein